MKMREQIPTAENTTNFDIVSDSTTAVGSTLDNLKSAIGGETGASAKYAAFAKAAKEQGYDQIARL
ncbi:MAG: ferritin family protein, partial [Gordonibacter sp.]